MVLSIHKSDTTFDITMFGPSLATHYVIIIRHNQPFHTINSPTQHPTVTIPFYYTHLLYKNVPFPTVLSLLHNP